ncbi:hypothetical protein THAOC_37825, partial [Thalassiosira oceanica]
MIQIASRIMIDLPTAADTVCPPPFPRGSMSCHVMSCHVMSCHVMSCHVMSCHVMSCHVMSCH